MSINGKYLFIIFLVLILFGWVARTYYLPKLREREQLQSKKEALQEEVAQKRAHHKSLQTQRERLQEDPRFVERIVREELGFAKTNETVYKFKAEGED